MSVGADGFRHPAGPRSAYPWLVVALLWFVGCINYMDRQAVFAVFPLLRIDLGLSDVDLALLGTVFLWVYALSSPLGGYLGDRLSRKRVVVASLLVFTSVTFCTGSAQNSSQLLWLRGLLGLSEAIYLPAALALISGYHSAATRSRAIGIHQSGMLVGSILGSLFAGYMGDHQGWRFGFHVLGGLGIALTIIVIPVLRDAPARQQAEDTPKPSLRDLRKVLGVPTVLAVVFTGLCFSMATWVVAAWMPLYFFERFHLNLTQSGFNGTFYVSAATVGGLAVGGYLSDRWARRNRKGRMLLQLVGLGTALPGLVAVPFAPSVTALGTCLFLFGLGRGIWDCNNMPVFCDVVARRTWSTVYGAFNLANTLGGGLGVLLAGALRESLGIGVTLSAFSGLFLMAAAANGLAAMRFLDRDMAAAERDG